MKGPLLLTCRMVLVALAAVAIVVPPNTGVALAAGPLPPVPCVPVSGTVDRCPEWETVFEGARQGSDSLPASALAPDGGVLFAAGHAASADLTDLDAAVVAYDTATGAERWRGTSSPGSPEQAVDAYDDVEVNAAGSMAYATGSSCETISDAAGCDLLLTAFEASTGEVAWQDRVEGSRVGSDFGVALRSVDTNLGERIYVAGRSTGSDDRLDFFAGAYDATGQRRWTTTVDTAPGRPDGASAMVMSDDGAHIFLVGPSPGPGGSPGFAVVALAAADGAVVWQQRIETDATATIRHSIAFADGAVVVTGERDGLSAGPAPDYLTTAFDALSGMRLWTDVYDGPIGGVDLPTAAIAGPDGTSVLVTGMSHGQGYDFATIAYTARTGARRWVSRFDGPGRNGDAPWSAAVDVARGKVYLLGSTYIEGLGHCHLLLALDGATGEREWSTFRPGQGKRGAATFSSVSIHPSGTSIYAVGQIADPAGLQFDVVTSAFDVVGAPS